MTTTTLHECSPAEDLRTEVWSLARLAGPSMLTGLGWMLMGLVDTVMVGRLGAVELGAVALANSLYFTVFVCLVGFNSAASPLISQTLGRGDLTRAGVYFTQARWMMIVVSPCLVVTFLHIGGLLELAGQDPAIVAGASSYLAARALAVIPHTLFSAHRGFLDGVGRPGRILRIVLAANVVNLVANRVLIFGWGPVPALGLEGAGIATSVCILALLVGAVLEVRREEYQVYRPAMGRPDRRAMLELLHLGWPNAAQHGIEVSVFCAIGLLVGWLGPVMLSVHQVAMSLLSLAFVLAGGIANAASVRIGEAFGRGDSRAVAFSGRVALGFASVMMGGVGTLYLAIPRQLAGIYTSDVEVATGAAGLLSLASVVVLFDGLQVVAASALRATSDSRTAFLAHSVAYWAVGLPVGYLLAFPLGWGLAGFWVGIGLALAVIGVWLTRVFLARAARV